MPTQDNCDDLKVESRVDENGQTISGGDSYDVPTGRYVKHVVNVCGTASTGDADGPSMKACDDGGLEVVGDCMQIKTEADAALVLDGGILKIDSTKLKVTSDNVLPAGTDPGLLSTIPVFTGPDGEVWDNQSDYNLWLYEDQKRQDEDVQSIKDSLQPECYSKTLTVVESTGNYASLPSSKDEVGINTDAHPDSPRLVIAEAPAQWSPPGDIEDGKYTFGDAIIELTASGRLTDGWYTYHYDVLEGTMPVVGDVAELSYNECPEFNLSDYVTKTEFTKDQARQDLDRKRVEQESKVRDLTLELEILYLARHNQACNVKQACKHIPDGPPFSGNSSFSTSGNVIHITRDIFEDTELEVGHTLRISGETLSEDWSSVITDVGEKYQPTTGWQIYDITVEDTFSSDISGTPAYTSFNIASCQDGDFVTNTEFAEDQERQDEQISYLQNEIVELEEEIDAIAPSVERGKWTFTAVGTVANPGQFTMYNADFGSGEPTGLFKDAKSIWFNEIDSEGTAHGFSDVDDGELLEIFVEGSPEYGLYKVVGKAHDETQGQTSFWVIDVEFVRTLEATTAIGPGEVCRFKVFMAPTGGDATTFLSKYGDDVDDATSTVKYKWNQHVQFEGKDAHSVGFKSGHTNPASNMLYVVNKNDQSVFKVMPTGAVKSYDPSSGGAYMASDDRDLTTKKYVDSQLQSSGSPQMLHSGWNRKYKYVPLQSLDINEFATNLSSSSAYELWLFKAYKQDGSAVKVLDYDCTGDSFIEFFEWNDEGLIPVFSAGISQILQSTYAIHDAKLSLNRFWAKDNYSFNPYRYYVFTIRGLVARP